MKKTHAPLMRCIAAAALATAAGLAGGQTSQSDIHRDVATKNTGNDPFMLQYARAFYCNLADDNNAIVIAARAWNNTTGTGDNAIYRIPLTQIFDDVWFVGNHYVGQYLIKTADGIVQLDAANNAGEVALFNGPALQALGMSASYPLKAVMLTHGHGDHDGGASWLKANTTNPEIFLGSADAAGKPYAPTTLDSTNLALRQVNIGGKNIWILPTPGHTPGSTSAVVEVKDWGRTVRVLMNGGQSMTNSIPQVAQYLDSIERTYAVVKALKVEGVMTPHIYWDGEGEKMRDILANGRSNPSQHVYGHDAVVKQMVVARECSAAWLTRLDTTLTLPVWRLNTLKFSPGAPSAGNVGATLANGWGPLVGRTVKFTVGANRVAACTGVTNSAGVASCSIPNLRPNDLVTASYPGEQTADVVDLPAAITAAVPAPAQ